MEKNNREEVQFQTLRKAPAGVMKKKELSAENCKKAFTWLQFCESKQTTFCSAYDEFPTLG